MQTKLKSLTLLTLLTLTLTPLTSACTNQNPNPQAQQTQQTQQNEQDTTPPEVLWDGPELTKPTTWNQINPQAAADAVEYFMQSYMWGMAHKDLSIFKEMSHPNCAACNGILDDLTPCFNQAVSWFATHPISFETKKINTYPNDPFSFEVIGTYKSKDFEQYCPEGGKTSVSGVTEQIKYIVTSQEEGGWIINAFASAEEDDA